MMTFTEWRDLHEMDSSFNLGVKSPHSVGGVHGSQTGMEPDMDDEEGEGEGEGDLDKDAPEDMGDEDIDVSSVHKDKMDPNLMQALGLDGEDEEPASDEPSDDDAMDQPPTDDMPPSDDMGDDMPPPDEEGEGDLTKSPLAMAQKKFMKKNMCGQGCKSENFFDQLASNSKRQGKCWDGLQEDALIPPVDANQNVTQPGPGQVGFAPQAINNEPEVDQFEQWLASYKVD
jgi:hypothetical protein